jgi:hypothetical protein
MKKKSSLILITLIVFLFILLVFTYFITRTSQNILAKEVVHIYESNTKTKPQNLETRLSELDKRYFNNELKTIPQWDNFSFTGTQVIKTKNEHPVLLLFYQNNSYQSPLLTVVYSNEHIKSSVLKPYRKWNTDFITYKDYEMPVYEKDGYTYIAICAFNTQTHLHGAIDLNREKDWQNALKSLQWVQIPR